MTPSSLKDALRRPDAFPHQVGRIELAETHASLVFLAGSRAYKIKKPVDLGFLDYSTLAKRRHYCREEVRLNRRLAPEIYLDVRPVVGDPPRVAAADEDVDEEAVREWVVVMKRLDPQDHLRRRLADGRLPEGSIERIAERLKEFYAQADRGGDIDDYASFDTVSANALDNFEQRRQDALQILKPSVLDRIEEATRRRLESARPQIEARHRDRRARDTHGDLRLEHIYLDEDGGLHIIDCIEFCDAFRYADPLLDVCFLAMDLEIRGYLSAYRALWQTFLGDGAEGLQEELRDLIDLYCSYRSSVRAKVHGVKAQDTTVDEDARDRARRLARAHWYYAWWKACPPGEGPALMLLGGLPASGKSTRARRLREQGFVDVVIDSDVVRKQLARQRLDLDDPSSLDDAPDDWESGIYTPAWTRRTYEAMARQAKQGLLDGKRVALAASFRDDQRRRQFIDVARSLGLPVRFFECTLDDDLARRRLAQRQDDPSDADWSIYQSIKESWDAPSADVAAVHRRLAPSEEPGELWDQP